MVRVDRIQDFQNRQRISMSIVISEPGGCLRRPGHDPAWDLRNLQRAAAAVKVEGLGRGHEI